MSITIKKNVKPKLSPVLMNCDNILDKKLEMYDLTKLAFSQHSTTMFVGRPGSGKSSFLTSLFTPKLLKNVYHVIFVFQPESSRKSNDKDIFAQLPEEQCFDDLNLENLQQVMDTIKSEPELNYLIIFDDMGSALKNKSCLTLLKQMMMNKRHLHLSMFFLCQTFYTQNKEIRRLFNNYFIFKVCTNDLRNITDEILEIDKDLVPKIRNMVFTERFNFLYIHIDSQRLFKNFDEILIKNGDDDVENISA
jgi:Poxvirus A32 protein